MVIQLLGHEKKSKPSQQLAQMTHSRKIDFSVSILSV